MIRTAVVMCGGKSSKCGKCNKALEIHRGRTIISYVFEALSETCIENIIVLANELNCNEVELEAKKFPEKKFIIANHPPNRFRELLVKAENALIEGPVLVVAGNQAMHGTFLNEIMGLFDREKSPVVTLYEKSLSKESVQAGLGDGNCLVEGGNYIVQHPFVLTKEILELQREENFSVKIEQTIMNYSKACKVSGIKARMPPEFDNPEMLRASMNYIDMLDATAFFIPGNSSKNLQWVDDAKAVLSPLFPFGVAIHYSHWDTKEPVLDLEHELGRFISASSGKKRIFIIAKSAGILLALKAIHDGHVSPEKCIFLGFPLAWANKQGFDVDKWMEGFSVPALFIQNEHDPACSFRQLKATLEEWNCLGYSLFETEGSHHDYEELDCLAIPILNFLSQGRGKLDTWEKEN